MLKFKCQTCYKEFSKKDHLIYHTEKRKKPCQPLVQKNAENCSELLKNAQIVQPVQVVQPVQPVQSTQPDQDKLKMQENVSEENFCKFCGLYFKRKDSISRHLRLNCKVKKLEKQEKEAIFNLLLEKEKEKNLMLESQLKDTKDQINNFSNVIKDLKDEICKQKEKIVNQNINKGVINNVTNIIIPQSKLANFGTEDVSKIDYNCLLKSSKQTGVHGLLSCFRDIYFNQKNPEYQNVYIADNSRDKIMTYSDNDWKINYLNFTIDTIMSKLEDYIELNKSKIETGVIKIVNDPKGEKVLSNIKKNLIKYLEKYNGTSNDSTEAQMQRFEKYMIKLLRNELCNIKDKVIENFDNIKEDVLQNVKQIDLEND